MLNTTLSDLNIGKKAIVKKIKSNDSIRRRFLDIGLTKGTEVEAVLLSPSKDPIAYFIRGALIAIRREDAKNILVEIK